MKTIRIQRLSALTPQISLLEKEATSEGFRFLKRLVDEWEAGINRFAAQGECLPGVFVVDRQIAIGGITTDPHTLAPCARLRRLFVSKDFRRQQIGRLLVEHLLHTASGDFPAIRLYTDTTEGATFYERCGFQKVDEPHASHIKQFTLS